MSPDKPCGRRGSVVSVPPPTLVRVERSDAPLPFLKEWVTWGAGPRASQFLVLGAKAHAAVNGRKHASVEDVRAVAHPVLRHRIVTNFTAQAEGITSDFIIDRLLEEVQPGATVAAGLPGVQGS